MTSIESRAQDGARHARAGYDSAEDSDYLSAVSSYISAADILEACALDALLAACSAAHSADAFDRVAECATRATKLSAECGLAWYWLGSAHLAQGNPDSARRSFRRAATVEDDVAKKASYMEWAERCDRVDRIEELDATTSSSRATATTTNVASNDNDVVDEKTEKAHTHPPTQNTPRMEWYQSSTHVTVDVYAKNVDRQQSSVEFSDSRIVARLARPDGPEYVLDKTLFAAIVPDDSSWSCSKFKAEIRMRKAADGAEWATLDGDGAVHSAAARARADGQQRMRAVEQKQKDWDAIATKELEGYKDDDGAMGVFKSIYQNADDDAKRAMLKSYQESGGKVLSTDWSDVGSRKVEYEEKD